MTCEVCEKPSTCTCAAHDELIALAEQILRPTFELDGGTHSNNLRKARDMATKALAKIRGQESTS